VQDRRLVWRFRELVLAYRDRLIEPDRWMVKVNPMATWTHQEVWKYLKDHDLPHNPLYDLGYSSIGCAPCTRMRFAGEPERAGRWAGKPKFARTPCTLPSFM
jgi:phosphoadenosine phosphosulfate reductase